MPQSGFDPRTLPDEERDVRYAVFFWEQGEAPPGVDPAGVGYCSDEFLLEDMSFEDVEAWIEINARGRTHELFIIFGSGSMSRSHKLRGEDPTVDVDPSDHSRSADDATQHTSGE